MLIVAGCGQTEVKKLGHQSDPKRFRAETKKITTLAEEIVGSYDNFLSVSEDGIEERLVFFENGTVENFLDGKKVDVQKWEVVGREVHIVGKMITFVHKIEPNGDLTWFAQVINGKRTDRRQVTFRKLKE